jgi:cytosine deaminase
MAIHVAQMAGVEDKKKIFDALTVNSAKTMGLEGYGLDKGCKADFVILQAADTLEALRLKPNRIAVIKGGKVIARTAPRIGELFLDGRPKSIDGGRDYVPKI